MSTKFTVGACSNRCARRCSWSCCSDSAGLSREILSSDVSSPGLALAGYVERFPPQPLQVFGETEVTYLESLDARRAGARSRAFFSFRFRASSSRRGSDAARRDAARPRAIAVCRFCARALKTNEFYTRVKPWLEDEFAPPTKLHGSLADVYGVGLLFMGQSGIGKSECVLDLVERGHRLVADDLVIVRRRGTTC